MMRTLLTLAALAATLVSCGGQQPAQQQTDQPQAEEPKASEPKLVKAWETPAELMIPESVLHHPENNILYVSNINNTTGSQNPPLEKDGDGFISKVNLDGTIETLKWAEGGLHAPKGMGIANGMLYVTDIDRVAEIDLNSGEVKRFFDLPGAKFLNDISIADDGIVYVSDYQDSKVYKLDPMADAPELVLFIDGLDTPNGLFVMGDKLLIGLNGSIMAASLADGTLMEAPLVSKTGGVDGLEQASADGTLVFSNWSGHLYVGKEGGEAIELLATEADETQSADIGYNMAEKIVYVPTFFKNTVAAYRLEM